MSSPFNQPLAALGAAVALRLANASASWRGGAPLPVVLDTAPSDAFGEVVTAALHTVSLDVGKAPGIAEGDELHINGRRCRVSGEVVPDAGGWASFPVVFEEGP